MDKNSIQYDNQILLWESWKAPIPMNTVDHDGGDPTDDANYKTPPSLSCMGTGVDRINPTNTRASKPSTSQRTRTSLLESAYCRGHRGEASRIVLTNSYLKT